MAVIKRKRYASRRGTPSAAGVARREDFLHGLNYAGRTAENNLFPPPALAFLLSQTLVVEADDVISTGTPDGIGAK